MWMSPSSNTQLVGITWEGRSEGVKGGQGHRSLDLEDWLLEGEGEAAGVEGSEVEMAMGAGG